MTRTVVPFRTSARRGAIGRGLLLGLGCLGVIVLLAIVAVAMGVGTYNSLVKGQENAAQKWANVENLYQRRYDLIPNLVETVKGAAAFETTTLTQVTEARASVGRAQLPSRLPEDPAEVQRYIEAQQQLGSALARLLVVSEQYPELRANQSFLSLQDQLEGTENRISVGREDYTVAVREYNTHLRGFPANVVAGMFGFDPLVQLDVPEQQQQAPRVDFGGR
jgi:LemA protein